MPEFTTSPVERASPRSEWAAQIHDFCDYINRLSDDRDAGRQVDTDLARMALKVWWKCFGSFDSPLAILDFGAGEEGKELFIWKRDQHYLSIEITPGGLAEVFYRDQRTGAIWGQDFDPSDREIPGPILARLAHFVAGD